MIKTIGRTRLLVMFALLGLLLSACGAPTEDSGESSGEHTERGERLGRALIPAAGRGDAEEVERLLKDGASVDVRDEDGRTALVAAAYGNHLQVAELLIEAGADVNAKDETEQSAYLISTSEVGDDPRLLRLALRNGADVESLDSYDGTGLIRAAERGYVEITKELLETDVDVNHINNLEWTALLEAIILGDGGERHTEVVRLLVEAGADVNLADGNGVTPLEHARERDFEEIAGILEDAGARQEPAVRSGVASEGSGSGSAWCARSPGSGRSARAFRPRLSGPRP